MDKFADLHLHSNYSDGTQSPRELVQQAQQIGLSCIALTDHDNVEGVPLALAAGKEFNVEVIPGFELSTEVEGKDVHILGYFIDHQSSLLKEKLREIQKIRVERIKKMLILLKAEGINNIELEEVSCLVNSDALGRLHLATVLEKKGWVKDKQEAFNRFIGEEGPAYVRKYKQSPHEAIELILKLGGVAVMAHPMVTYKDEIISGLVEAGLGGMEVYYPNYYGAVIRYYEGLAKKYNLILTGGSDGHGAAKDNTTMGKVKVPYGVVEQLKQACAKTI